MDGSTRQWSAGAPAAMKSSRADSDIDHSDWFNCEAGTMQSRLRVRPLGHVSRDATPMQLTYLPR